jgi:hypothetical protein
MVELPLERRPTPFIGTLTKCTRNAHGTCPMQVPDFRGFEVGVLNFQGEEGCRGGSETTRETIISALGDRGSDQFSQDFQRIARAANATPTRKMGTEGTQKSRVDAKSPEIIPSYVAESFTAEAQP